MRNIVRTVALVSCLAIAVSGSATLAADNWLGFWKLDRAASKFKPGPAPRSQTLKFEGTEAGIKLTSLVIEADGKARNGEYVSKFDGTDVPWKGNPDADTSSAERIDDNSYTNAWKKGGKVVIKSKVVVSPDGKTLTITQTGKNAKGEAIDNTLVFHRK